MGNGTTPLSGIVLRYFKHFGAAHIRETMLIIAFEIICSVL